MFTFELTTKLNKTNNSHLLRGGRAAGHLVQVEGGGELTDRRVLALLRLLHLVVELQHVPGVGQGAAVADRALCKLQ